MSASPTMILAAGLGTRLRPLTDECPKPLVPIGDRPAIEHVLDRVRGLGPIVVNAHHFAAELTRALEPAGVSVSHEAELLGTAGGLAHAAPLLGGGDVLVWNADVLAPLDARAIVGAHRASGDDATLVVSAHARPGEGNVGLDRDGRVVRLRRETFAPGEVRGGDFLGVHVIGESLRAALPRAGCLVGDLYLPRGHAGARLRAFVTDVTFVDVGTLSGYLEANFAWLRGRSARSFVRASIPSGVTVGTDVIVPEGCSIAGGGVLERVVAWPGARVEAPLRDAIVTPRGVAFVDGSGAGR
jgi:mannose-1-phosphate guanylyltransferase